MTSLRRASSGKAARAVSTCCRIFTSASRSFRRACSLKVTDKQKFKMYVAFGRKGCLSYTRGATQQDFSLCLKLAFRLLGHWNKTGPRCLPSLMFARKKACKDRSRSGILETHVP